MILTIAISIGKFLAIWTLASIIGAECWALMRANQRSRQRESRELARMIELGGAAIIPSHSGDNK